MLLGNFERMPRALEIRARHNELGAADILGPLDDSREIVRVSSGAMVDSTKDGICEVYANLLGYVRQSASHRLWQRG
jgi:hypothetical protein